MAMVKVRAQVHYPRKTSSLVMALLREDHILGMFHPQDYKATLKSNR